MTVTLPNYISYDPTAFRNLEVRVGTASPSSTVAPWTVNTRCVKLRKLRGLAAGKVVAIPCTDGIVGTVVSIQIRCAGRMQLFMQEESVTPWAAC